MSATSVAVPARPGRDPRRLQRLGAVLGFAGLAEAIAIAVLGSAGNADFVLEANLPTLGFLASIVLFPAVGGLIVQRRPLSRVAWLLIFIGIGLGIGLVLFGYGALVRSPMALLLAQLFFVPIPAPAITWLLLVFPDDRLIGPRWRLVGTASALGGALYGLGSLARPGLIDPEATVRAVNPLAGPEAWAAAAEIAINAGNTMVVLSLLLAAGSQFIRYRSAGPVERAQIRWIALVAALAAPTLAVSALQAGPVSDLAFGLGMVFLACMPLAIGVAITRYHLYDIDRLINRTLVYGSLTAILAGVFTAAVGLAQRMFVAMTGETSDAAIVMTTLVVATLYAPLRKRLESVVDVRFKYDERRFGGYRDEVKRVLSIVEPGRAAMRLASESVRELGARGAAVVDAAGRPVATAGEWPVPPSVRLPVPGAAGGLAALLVGARADGRPHDPRAIAELEEIVALVASGMRRPD